MKKLLSVLILSSLVLIITLTGCSTTVAFDVLKPAEVNMSEYRTLAVFDYEPYELTKEYFAGKLILSYLFGSQEIGSTGFRLYLDDEIARYMTDRTINTLGRTGYFTIIRPDQLRPFQNYNTAMLLSNRSLYESLGVDAAILGTIEDMDYSETVDEREKKIWNEETEVYDTQIEAYFIQEVELGISYTVVDVRQGTILATEYLSGRKRDSTFIKDPDTFQAPSLENLYKEIARGFETQISRKLAPYYVREYRNIKDDKSKDPRSKTAKEFIKSSMYKNALNLYLEMWYESGNTSAGFNAAIVYEVLGQFDSAIAVIKDVYDSTGLPDAYKEYKRLEQVKAESQKAAQQY